MKFRELSLASVFSVILISIWLISPDFAYNAFLYKSYIIRCDRGWDILCDPYVVKKDDWLYKLFRQKGEIANKDFPEFLRIFKRINPHIHDIDKIRAGQHIIIPLKKLPPNSMSGQSSGVVTIPFLNIPKIPETLKTYSTKYTVQKGDCISIVISKRYGPYGGETYKQGIKLFKLINPDLKDLNRIYAGQNILIPDPAIRKQPWYQSLFDQLENNKNLTDFNRTIKTYKKTQMLPVSEDREKKQSFPLSKVAWAVDAKLSTKGVYYFPRQGQKDLKIDLSKIPLIELENGTRILFPMDDNKNIKSELDMVKSFWKDVHIVQITPNDSEKHVFDAVFGSLGKGVLKNRLVFFDQGVEVEVRGKWIFDKIAGNGKTVRHFCISLIDNPRERTPESILRYLNQKNIVLKEILKGKNTAEKPNSLGSNKSTENVSTIDSSDQKTFISDLITAMGYKYSPNVIISFPYSGIQVKSVSNLITGSNGNPFLVDFGDFYGDAVSAIEKTGFTVIQIKYDDNFHVIIQKILDALDVSYTNNPIFLAARRPAIHNTVFTIPGFLVSGAEKSRMLFSFATLHNEITQFMTNQGVKISMIQPSKKVIQHINKVKK